MTIYRIPRHLGSLCTALAAVMLAAGYAVPAAAQQFHAFGVQMSCDNLSKIGEEVTCISRGLNQDEFADAHEVKEFWHVVDPGGMNMRLPAAGNLPITAVSGGTSCTATAVSPDAPIGLTFPCDVPSTGGVTPFEFVEVQSTHTVPAAASDPDNVQATALEADLCDDPNTAGCSMEDNTQQQPASINLFQASIDVTKTGPATAKVGDEFEYTISFENTSSGDTPALVNCTGNDPLLGGDLGAFQEGVARTFPFTPGANDPNPLVNTATITCDVEGFENQLSDSDDHSVNLFAPGVALTKECSPAEVEAGDVIEWTITVQNTGDASLACVLNDAEAGFIGEAFSLAAGASDTFNASRTVDNADADAGFISNTAALACDVEGFDNQVSATASADCAVVSPGELPPVEIPTLNQWGLLALAGLLLGLAYYQRRRSVLRARSSVR